MEHFQVSVLRSRSYKFSSNTGLNIELMVTHYKIYFVRDQRRNTCDWTCHLYITGRTLDKLRVCVVSKRHALQCDVIATALCLFEREKLPKLPRRWPSETRKLLEVQPTYNDRLQQSYCSFACCINTNFSIVTSQITRFGRDHSKTKRILKIVPCRCLKTTKVTIKIQIKFAFLKEK